MCTLAPVSPPHTLSDPADSPSSRTSDVAVGLFIVFIGVLTVLYSCFLDRSPSLDEIGLHNPIYMLQTYGTMTYPVHGHFHYMVIHPPLVYWITTLLTMVGFPLFLAVGVLLSALSFCCLWLIWRGPFSQPMKLAVPAALFMATFLWHNSPPHLVITLRPDCALAIAWLTGLVALESARLRGWHRGDLFLGGFFITFAACTHYTAGAVGLSLAIYALWIWRAPAGTSIRTAILFMTAGAALLAVPYASFWAVPYFKKILRTTLFFNEAENLDSAVDSYFQAYAVWKAALASWWEYRPVVTALMKNVIEWGIPAGFLGAGLLFAFRSTRALAIAGLPHFLFVMMFVRGGLKASFYQGYYVPEFIFLLTGTLLVASAGLVFILKHTRSRFLQRCAVPAMALALAAGILEDIRSQRPTFTSRLDDLDIARACAREINGPEATVAYSSLATWYAGGGQRVYYLTNDIAEKDLSFFDKEACFQRFDGIVLHGFGMEHSNNRQRRSLASFYEDGTLKLNGFYFSDRRRWHESDLGFLILSLNEKSLKGFGYHKGLLSRFHQDSDGDEVFACYLGPVDELSNQSLGMLDFYQTIPLPPPTPKSKTERALRAFVMLRKDYEKRKPELLARATLLNEVAVRRINVDVAQMLSSLRLEDRPIEFLRSLSEAGARNPPEAVAGH